MNIDTGELRPWDELTDEEKLGGKWVRLSDRVMPSRPSPANRQVREDEVANRRTANKAARRQRRKQRRAA